MPIENPYIGMLVVANGTYDGRDFVDAHGNVVGIDGGFVSIEFDENIGGHTCGGLARDGHGFNVPSAWAGLSAEFEAATEDQQPAIALQLAPGERYRIVNIGPGDTYYEHRRAWRGRELVFERYHSRTAGPDADGFHTIYGIVQHPGGVEARSTAFLHVKLAPVSTVPITNNMYRELRFCQAVASGSTVPDRFLDNLGRLAEYILNLNPSLVTDEEYHQLESAVTAIQTRLRAGAALLGELFEEV